MSFKNNFFKGISLNVLLLGLVSLLTDMGSQIVFPLIPLFLSTELKASALIIGLIEGSAIATASFFKVFSGYFSDEKHERKPFILFGYTLSSLMKPLFAFAFSWLFVLFIRIFERIGKGVRDAPRDALVAESTPAKFRGRAFGFQRALDGIGSVLGAVLAFLLLPLLGFRMSFLSAFVPSVLAILLIFFVKEKKKKVVKKIPSLQISFSKLSSKLKFFILIIVVFSLGNFGYAFLLLKVLSIGLASQEAILFYVLFYFTYSLLVISFSSISDKIGRKKVLFAGYFLFSLTAFLLAFTSSVLPLILLFVLFGLFFALTDGVERAFVVDLAPMNLKATALGTFYTVKGFSAIPAGLIAGFLWGVNPKFTFLFGFVFSLIALLLLYFLKEDKK